MVRHSISVIFPVYNEEATLERGLSELIKFLDGCNLSTFEVVVIESGSTDSSAQIADGMAERWPCIRVIHEGRRNGFGAAVRLGYRSARMEWIWLVTPDLPFPLKSLETALPLLEEYDAILSYRLNASRRALRRVQSFVFNSLVKLMFGLRVRCVNSAFKLIRRRLVQDIDFQSRGWTIDTELIWVLQARGARIIEIPVELIERSQGVSKIAFSTSIFVIRELIQLRLGGRTGPGGL